MKAPATTARAVLHGALGFAAVSLAAFSVWAFGGKALVKMAGNVGLYAAVAIAFMGLSGVVLHPLAGSLGRFYKAFVPAFLAYAVVWTAIYLPLETRLSEWLASAAGTLVFTVAAGALLGNLRPWLSVAVVLFVTHSIGYFLGSIVYTGVKPEVPLAARLGWGLCYGLGFGAGLGYAFISFGKRPA